MYGNNLEKKKRNQTILEMHRAGCSIGDIARRFVVSRERIRQIIKKALPVNGAFPVRSTAIMFYHLKESNATAEDYLINTNAVTSITWHPAPQEGFIITVITVAGVALKSMYLMEQDFQAFVAEVQKAGR